MPFIKKTKPGLLSRLFNSDKPQPATLPSLGEKTIDEDGDVIAPADQAGPSRGLFSSRRAERTPAAEVVDVADDEESQHQPGNPEAGSLPPKPTSTMRTTLAGLLKPRKAALPAGETAATDPEDASPPVASGGSDNALKPASKLAGMFGSRKPAPKSEPPLETTATLKDQKPAKKTKPAKKQKSGSAPISIILLTELGENGKSLLWEMSATKLAQVPVTSTPVEVVSFSKEDIRFHMETPTSYSKALDMAIEEVGELVAVVNRSKDLSAMYCTREERATASPYRVAAGQQALDLLLKKTGRAEQSLVTGFSLKDESGQSSVVVLYAVSADGESSKPQVTVNPDNMEFVLSQFTSSRKINRKETEVVLFTNEDLLSVAADIKPFADEKVWNGIPVRVLQNAGAGLTGLIAAGAVGWAALGYTQKQLLAAQTAKVQVKAKALTEKNNELIGSSLISFADKLSQDQVRMFSLAQQVWVPTSKVSAEMKADETKITVVLPLVLGGTFNNGPSVNAVADAANVRRLYEKEAPEGCSKSQPQTTGNLNEIRIDIVCQAPDSTFHRYRGD